MTMESLSTPDVTARPTGFRLTSACIITMNDDFSVVQGDLAVAADGTIVAVGDASAFAHWPATDVGGDYILPGFVQAHIHLCQTLFRHEAETRTLLTWLRERIWPLEGAHTPESLRTSADLGIAELLLSGTTALLDMGTVHHQTAVCEAVRDSGIRATVGKAMMDTGEAVPASLLETTANSLDESVALARTWHGHDGDRVRYAFAPRFVLSCTEELQREVGRLSAANDWGIHTHASEQLEEIAVVQSIYGRKNIDALHEMGLCGHRTVLAHCVHVDHDERRLLAGTRTSVCHCPGSNMKLGSGIADIPGLRKAGINVALGADGAPCNNQLDQFVEMRLAQLLQAGTRGPGTLSPREVLHMATRAGALALNQAHRIGQITTGFDADIIRLRRSDARFGLGSDPYTEIVSAGCRDLVRDVWVKGRHLVQNGVLTTIDTGALRERGRRALDNVIQRAGL
jgi:5-methylthioadenosine/S-adenosylhomocysteine deaminase